MFHDSVAAALEWSTRDPAVGLRLLRLPRPRVARKRPSASRADRGRPAADRRERRTGSRSRGRPPPPRSRPRRHGPEPVRGAAALLLRRRDARRASRRRVPRRGQRHVARLHGGQLRAGATARRTSEGNATSSASPPWARPRSRSKRTRAGRWRCSTTPDFRAAAHESRYLRDFADRTAGRAALYLGDLDRCLEVARGLCSSPSLADRRVRREAPRAPPDCSPATSRPSARRPPSRRSASSRFPARRTRPMSRCISARCSPERRPASTPTSGPRTSTPAIRLPAYVVMLLCREADRCRRRRRPLEAVRRPAARDAARTSGAGRDRGRGGAGRGPMARGIALAVEHGLPPGGRRRARRACRRGGRRPSPGSSASGSRPRRPGCGTRPGTDGGSPSSRLASTPPSRPPPRPSDRTGPVRRLRGRRVGMARSRHLRGSGPR